MLLAIAESNVDVPASSTDSMFDPIPSDMLGDARRTHGCNCRLSKCIKMYCECFAAGVHCGPSCRCSNCENGHDNEPTLAKIRQGIRKRNPMAFEIKIRHTAVGARRHTQGCRCTKSKCLKRYCECFREGMPCSKECQCVDCHNGQHSSSELPAVSPVMTDEDAIAELVASDLLTV